MLNRISKYRDVLKCIAIIGVMAVHSQYHPVSYLGKAIVGFGYCGADLFMFISGFGLYCSLFKDDDFMRFYKRRILNIFPAFIPILIIKFFVIDIYEFNLLSFFLPKTFIMFFKTLLGNLFGYASFVGVGISFNWYINTIICFYFITPMIYRLIMQKKKYVCTLLVIVSFFISLTFVGTSYAISILRLPIFVLGICLGYMYKNKMEIGCKIETLIIILGTVLFVILSYGVMITNKLDNDILKYYTFFIIIPAGVSVITKMMEFVESKDWGGGDC